mgnify:FL=1
MKPFPSYRQLDIMDCGPTCLKIIAKYYGRDFSIQKLREKSYITRTGVSMLGISDAAEEIGFRTRGVKITFNQLVSQKPLPCILHWSQNHFVVCYGIKKRKKKYQLKISDPAGEKYVMDEFDFLKCWISSSSDGESKGMALLLYPTPKFYQQEEDVSSPLNNILLFKEYIKPYKRPIIHLIISLLVSSIFSLTLPFLTQSIVDQGIQNNNLNFVTLVLLAQLTIFVTLLALEFIRNWIILHINNRISISLISDFLSKLMKLPICFFDTKNIGDIMQRIEDNERIKSFLTSNTLTLLFSFVNFGVFSIVLGYYSYLILIVFILGNSLYIGWVCMFLRFRRKLDIARFSQASAEQSSLVQIVTGMQEIKLNNNEKEQRWRWERIQIKLFNISIKGLAFGQYQQIGSVFFSQTTSLIISFIVARLVITGDMTLGMMMSVSYIIGQLSGPIAQFINFTQSAQDALISLERLNEIHNMKNEEEIMESKMLDLPLDKTFSIKNLYFSYSGADRDYILQNINLTIPANKITAIVGASGSGKTTLIKLLLGFYQPNKGEILISNTPINNINPHLWRQKTGAVMQDGFIFSDTIRNNIVIERNCIDNKKLQDAVEISNIKDFIETLPLKYETKIGMEGNGISQGQRQRILIARVIYKNPDILFFDEATNALDANNEKQILDRMNKFYNGKTVIIIAHRLSTVQNADNIVVMDKGIIAEQGTHQALVAKKGVYYSLVKNQLELGL